MKVKANVSFSGRISMAKGEKREITDEGLLKDLLTAGYVEEVVSAKRSKATPSEQMETGSEGADADPPDQKEAEPEDEGK